MEKNTSLDAAVPGEGASTLVPIVDFANSIIERTELYASSLLILGLCRTPLRRLRLWRCPPGSIALWLR